MIIKNINNLIYFTYKFKTTKPITIKYFLRNSSCFYNCYNFNSTTIWNKIIFLKFHNYGKNSTIFVSS